MNKKIGIVMIVGLLVLSGCVVADEFERIKQDYLEGRVEQLLTAIPSETPAAKMPTIAPSATKAEDKDVEETDETQETPAPTATPTLEPSPTIDSDDPAVYLGDPAWHDPMDEAKYWPTGSDQYSSAYYENGYLRMTALHDNDGWRLASTESLGNNYIEATFTTETCEGTDHYGLMFRVPVLKEANRGYLFGLTCDGRYSLRKWDGTRDDEGLMVYLVRWIPDSSIVKGSNQTNQLGVMTIDERIVMFVNGNLVAEFSDDSFLEGYFGVFIGSDNTPNLTVRVLDVSYWSDVSLAE